MSNRRAYPLYGRLMENFLEPAQLHGGVGFVRVRTGKVRIDPLYLKTFHAVQLVQHVQRPFRKNATSSHARIHLEMDGQLLSGSCSDEFAYSSEQLPESN